MIVRTLFTMLSRSDIASLIPPLVMVITNLLVPQ